jgi:hypothetical protein
VARAIYPLPIRYDPCVSVEIVSAIAESATALIAGGALWFASGQVKEARATRKAVAQPNVAVYVDLNPTNWQYLDFVVKNFGQTPAFAIGFKGLPKLDVVPWTNPLTGDVETALYLPPAIAVLAPGQEWRTIWDSAVVRDDYEIERSLHPEKNMRELGSVFVGRVHYKDGENVDYENPIYLDIKAFRNMRRLDPQQGELQDIQVHLDPRQGLLQNIQVHYARRSSISGDEPGF